MMQAAPQKSTKPEVPLQILLFVDQRPNAKEQIQQIRRFLTDLRADYPFELQVIDVGEQPYLAEQFRLVATPALIKIHPDPRQTLMGTNLVAQLQDCWPLWQASVKNVLENRAELEDFTPEQVAELNRRHNLPFDANSLQQLFRLLGGHPYLVRKALYLVASGQITPTELFTNATAASGPFGDHLRRLLSLLYDKQELIQGLQLVISQNICPDRQIFWRLRGSGLVRASGQSALPRCQLYAEYFRENLHG